MRSTFFGIAFIVLGTALLVFHRMMAEEGKRWRAPWRPPVHPVLARMVIILGGIVTILLGIFLLTGMINWG